MAARSDQVLGKPTVGVPSYQTAVRTEAGPASPARVTDTAEQTGVDDNALAIPDALVPAFQDFARHLVSHDAGILYRDSAVVNLEIRAADTAVAYPHQNFPRARLWIWNSFEAHLVGRS